VLSVAVSCALAGSNALARPVLLEATVLDTLPDGSPRPIRAGDTVRIDTRWSEDSLTVTGDYVELDGSSAGAFVETLGPVLYRLHHQVPLDTTTRDGAELAIFVTAVNPSGEDSTFVAVRLCLSNAPPRWVSSELENPSIFGYRGGDSLYIATRWCSRDTLDLQIELDARAIAPEFEPDDARVVQREAGPCALFRIGWRIPVLADARAPDGDSLLLRITARDSGCGAGLDATVVVKLDSSGPETIPTLDPFPAETTSDSLRISGFAPGANGVAVLLNDALYVRLLVDAQERFETTVPLEENRSNKLAVWGEDFVGNRTRTSEARTITRVSDSGLALPRPFVRGEDEIVLRDPSGLGAAEISLFDLSGACLRRWQVGAQRLEFRAAWDGLDAAGDRAGQGLYLVRATWRPASGKMREQTAPLVLGE